MMEATDFSETAVKVKGKVFLVGAMKAYRGNRGLAPLILNFDSRWR